MDNIDALWDFNNPDETEQKFRALLDQTDDQNKRAEILTQIARTHSLRKQFDQAHQILSEAEALLKPNSRQHLRLLLERGRAHNSNGEKQKARPLFEQAWQLGQDLKEDRLAVDAAHMIAITHEGETALEWNQTALAYAEESPQEDARRWRKSLLNNIGWTHFDMGRHHTALETFVACQQAAQEMKDEQSERIARWSIGRTQRALGNVDDALAIQEALHEEYEALGKPSQYVEEELTECRKALANS